MSSLFEEARKYLALGFCPISIDKNKQSVFYWKRYQQRFPTIYELERMCNHPTAYGLALICGKISGGLEVIDIDLKYDLTGKLYSELLSKLYAQDRRLMDKLLIDNTKNGGKHFIYRCEQPDQYRYLARRPASEAELLVNPDVIVKVLIETRGEKGYIIVPPTPGYSLSQNDFFSIPTINMVQKQLLFETARTFNLYESVPKSVQEYKKILTNQEIEDSPMEDFDRRGDIIGLLVRHGWLIKAERSDKIVLKRPGDSDKWSSGDFNLIMRRFSTFSPNTPFEPYRAYKPYAVFAILECGGDFKEAARKLLSLGFGKPKYPARERKGIIRGRGVSKGR